MIMGLVYIVLGRKSLLASIIYMMIPPPSRWKMRKWQLHGLSRGFVEFLVNLLNSTTGWTSDIGHRTHNSET